MKLLARLLQVRIRQAGAAWVQGTSQGRLGGLCLQTPAPPGSVPSAPSLQLSPAPPSLLTRLPCPPTSQDHKASLLFQYPLQPAPLEPAPDQPVQDGVNRAPLTVLGGDTGCGTQGRDSERSMGRGIKVRGQGHDKRQSQSQASLRHRILSQVPDPQAR